MTSQVISFKKAKATNDFKKFIAQGDPRGLFEIPFNDIARISDSANTGNSDPVLLGDKAQRALAALFQEFGLFGLPETWGQLMGAVWYCRAVYSQITKIKTNPADDALFEEIGLNLYRKYRPELVESVIAYRLGDLPELKRIHEERLTWPVLSSHFHQSSGWTSQ